MSATTAASARTLEASKKISLSSSMMASATPSSNSNKFKLPSFRKLKSKLSLRKSQSTASNLADLSKKKIVHSNTLTNINQILNSNGHNDTTTTNGTKHGSTNQLNTNTNSNKNANGKLNMLNNRYVYQNDDNYRQDKTQTHDINNSLVYNSTINTNGNNSNYLNRHSFIDVIQEEQFVNPTFSHTSSLIESVNEMHISNNANKIHEPNGPNLNCNEHSVISSSLSSLKANQQHSYPNKKLAATTINSLNHTNDSSPNSLKLKSNDGSYNNLTGSSLQASAGDGSSTSSSTCIDRKQNSNELSTTTHTNTSDELHIIKSHNKINNGYTASHHISDNNSNSNNQSQESSSSSSHNGSAGSGSQGSQSSHSGGLSAFFSSFSSSSNNHSNGQVKLRNSNKKKLKNEIQKRISLPANINSILNLSKSKSKVNDETLNEQDEEVDTCNHPSNESSNHVKSSDQQHQYASPLTPDNLSNAINTNRNIALNSKIAMSNYNLASVKMTGSTSVHHLNQFNNINKLPNKKYLNQHIQSYQSLSTMCFPNSTHQANMNLMLKLKPLNRNSRRASMSELGYGKIESYNKLDKLGEGTYATVFKGQSTINGSFVALKEIRLEHDEGAPCTAIREVSLLKQLKHANIVTLHDIIYTNKSLTLVFEYLERDLKQYMDECNNIMSLKNVELFLFQLLRGLSYCHSKQILHRDLKPQNLLINQKGELKLADFGLARAKSIPTKTYSNEVVTLWYRPPDVLLGSTDYSTHIDMWGVGCIFYEMVSGKPLFPGTKVEDELYLIFKALGYPTEATFPGVTKNSEFLALNLPKFPTFDPSVFPILVPRLNSDGISLLASLLKYNPKSRASASESLNHKYFSFLPAEVYQLDNSQSIFDIPNLVLAKDPGAKLNNAILYESCI